MKDLTKLTDEELKERLASLKEDLQDTEYERGFTFKQSGVHVSSSKISIQMEEFDSEIARLKEEISACEEALTD
ncbi:hypothetical protein Q5O14_14965 [Eubacteriaceae bacterium ES2]|nr:hypothetical protein Q5O14_14965 [Eubacteriaceae bacterium ES2]